MRNIRISLFAAVGAAVLLSACSSKPSESDLRSAFVKSIDESQVQSEKLVGKNSIVQGEFDSQRKQAKDVKLIGCKDDGDNAYKCDIEFKGRSTQVRMVKGSDGWLLSVPQQG